jgi:hypothetical protein
MRGFTFSQLAVIVLVLIGLIAVGVLAVMFLTDYASKTGIIGGGIVNQGSGVGQALSDCESRGGACLYACGAKMEITANCEDENKICCV